MKKLLKFNVLWIFLLGMLVFTSCERDDNFTAPEESSLKCTKPPENYLRHVMLFEFNENTNSQTIRGFINALCSFKDSIKEVKDIEWGKNFNYSDQSPYSFCFIVSFSSLNDFLLYLNNPVHLNFINKWLNPNIKDALAFYYQGNIVKNDKGHIAVRELDLFNYQDNISDNSIKDVEMSFSQLMLKTRTVQQFEWGSELQLLGMNKNFTDGFLLSFKNPIDFYSYSKCQQVKSFFNNIVSHNTKEIIKVDYFKEK
jgi:hypothetical protein